MSNFSKAVEFYKRKNNLRAEELLRKAIAEKPDFVPAYILLGRIAEEEGDKDSAALNYRNAFDITRKRDFKLLEEDLKARDGDLHLQWQEAAYHLAEIEFGSENYNRAVYYCNAILEHDLEGTWKKKAFDFKQVTQEFFGYKKRLVELRNQNYRNPNDPRVKAEFAALFMEMASGVSRLHNLKSAADYVAMSIEWRRQAKKELAELYDASPEVKLVETEALLAYTESQEALIRGQMDRAIQKAKEACEKDPNSARYHFAVASLLMTAAHKDPDAPDQTGEVLEYARRAVELDPKSWRYLIFYAGRLQEFGQLEQSYKTLLKVREITSDKEVLKEVEGMLAAIEKALEAEKR